MILDMHGIFPFFVLWGLISPVIFICCTIMFILVVSHYTSFFAFRSEKCRSDPCFLHLWRETYRFTLSLSEGSNVCIWNHTGQDRNTSKPKKIMSSESFLSHDATIAIPWCGIESAPLSPSLGEELIQRSSLSSPDCFFMSRGFLSEIVPKVSATWPEETLLDSGQTVVSPTICKSEYRFLRSACKGMSNSHLWGQVIVTAGSDGFIRVYQNYGLPVRVWNTVVVGASKSKLQSFIVW